MRALNFGKRLSIFHQLSKYPQRQFWFSDKSSKNLNPKQNLYPIELFSDTIKDEHILPQVDEVSLLFQNSIKKPKLPQIQQEHQLPAEDELYSLSREEYIHYLHKCYNGDVTTYQYKDSKIYFIGARFDLIKTKSLYKILSNTRPNLILFQTRPDRFLSPFTYFFPKEGGFLSPIETTQNIDDYLSDITREGWEIMPSQMLRDEIHAELAESKILINKRLTDPEKLEVDPIYPDERLHLNIFGVASIYSENHDVPIILGDFPDLQMKLHIANSHSLMSLQNLFKIYGQAAGYDVSQGELTMLTSGADIYPEEFIHLSDTNMALTLKALIDRNPTLKKIVGFIGFGESRSLIHYMERSSHSLEDFYSRIKVDLFSTIVGKESTEMFIEKLAILDIILSFPIKIFMQNVIANNYAKYKEEHPQDPLPPIPDDKYLKCNLESIIEVYQQHCCANTANLVQWITINHLGEEKVHEMINLFKSLHKEYINEAINLFIEGKNKLIFEFKKQARDTPHLHE